MIVYIVNIRLSARSLVLESSNDVDMMINGVSNVFRLVCYSAHDVFQQIFYQLPYWTRFDGTLLDCIFHYCRIFTFHPLCERKNTDSNEKIETSRFFNDEKLLAGFMSMALVFRRRKIVK